MEIDEFTTLDAMNVYEGVGLVYSYSLRNLHRLPANTLSSQWEALAGQVCGGANPLVTNVLESGGFVSYEYVGEDGAMVYQRKFRHKDCDR